MTRGSSAMLLRPCSVLAVFLSLAASSIAFGQTTDAHDREAVDSPPAQAAPGRQPKLAPVADLIVRSTNEFRQQEKRKPVESNPQLIKTAQYFADYMARTNQYGHTADGNQPTDR